MSVRISRALLERMFAHAAREPEREVCGLLFASRPSALSLSEGRPSEPDEGRAGLRQAQPERIEDICETINASTASADSFEVDPAVLFAAIRAERGGGPRLIGHYHSHPNGSPTPSDRDALMADSPGRLWLILAGGEARLWREVPGGAVRGAFEAVPLVVEAGISG